MTLAEPMNNSFSIYYIASSYYFYLEAQVDNGTNDTPVYTVLGWNPIANLRAGV